MLKANETFDVVRWWIGHLLFTLIAISAVRGGWRLYEDLQNWRGAPVDITKLSIDQRNQLAQDLFSSGEDYVIPDNSRGNRPAKN